MDEFSDDSKLKARINLSRNAPVALVVGAAGFLGSWISEKLLDHRIQVIGVDNFSTGGQKNLEEAVKNSRFHFINTNAENLRLDPERLDYIFIMAGEGYRINNLLDLAKLQKSKIVFISWIDLYSHKGGLGWFKTAEEEIAHFAKENKLNARVLRLTCVFGPRMNFDVDDPIVSLIQAALEDGLQEESTALEFSTRAIYVEDAASLIIKSMLSGSTAWKIFDGVNPNPVKVAEIKQILLDPLWHESRGFTPSELPPWPTPNLEKSQKELHWSPKVSLIKALKETLVYFKDNDIKPKKLPNIEKNWHSEPPGIEEQNPESEKIGERKIQSKEKKKIKIPWGKMVILAIIFYAFIYPIMTFGLGLGFLDYQIKLTVDHLQKTRFEESLQTSQRAQESIKQIKDASKPFLAICCISFEKNLDLKLKLFQGLEHLSLGTKYLFEGVKKITGEMEGDANEAFAKAQVELTVAEELITSSALELKDEKLNFSSVSSKYRSLALFLPKFFSGEKNYLIILQDNSELRPTGGLISGVALLSLDNGKLEKIKTESLADLVEKSKNKEPPKEIKEDLGESNWTIKDANWEANFPVSAQRIEGFYQDSRGVKLDGVVALDLVAASNLIRQTGDLTLPNYKTKVTVDGVFQQVLSKQGGGSFSEELLGELTNKIFFQSSQKWAQTLDSLSRSLDEKHMLFYLEDSKLQLAVYNWGGLFPKTSPDDNSLAVVEANLGKNKANYFLDRKFELAVNLSKDGTLDQILQINYSNKSVNNIWPGGTYKNRVRIYIPLGSKLNSFKLGEEDLTSKTEVATEFGRAVYSVLLNVDPAKNQTLTLDYKLPLNLKIVGGKTRYSLNWIKQPGTEKDPVVLKLPMGQTLNLDLDKDQKIESEIFL